MHGVGPVRLLHEVEGGNMPAVHRRDLEFAGRRLVPLFPCSDRGRKCEATEFIGTEELFGEINKNKFSFLLGWLIKLRHRAEILDNSRIFGNFDEYALIYVSSVHSVKSRHIDPSVTEELFKGLTLLHTVALKFYVVVAWMMKPAK